MSSLRDRAQLWQVEVPEHEVTHPRYPTRTFLVPASRKVIGTSESVEQAIRVCVGWIHADAGVPALRALMDQTCALAHAERTTVTGSLA